MTEPSKTPRTDSDPLSDDDLDRLEHDWTKDVTWHNAEARLMATVRKLQRSLSDATSDLDNARENWNGFIDPINTFCTGEPDFVIRHEGGPREAAQNVIDFIKARGDYAVALREELHNIAFAKRHDPEYFSDDREFGDWAQSRARHTLGRTENKASQIKEGAGSTPAQSQRPGGKGEGFESPDVSRGDKGAGGTPDKAAAESAVGAQNCDAIGQTEGAWLIFFEDSDVKPEVFSGAGADRGARERFKQVSANWNATLFAAVGSNFRDGPSLFSGRWIPVGERMPPQVGPTVWSFPDDRQILARNSGGYMACVTALYRAMGGVICGEDATPEETEDRIGDVTHWMELPADPDRNCDSQVPVRCDGRDINKCPNPTQCEIEGKCLAEGNAR